MLLRASSSRRYVSLQKWQVITAPLSSTSIDSISLRSTDETMETARSYEQVHEKLTSLSSSNSNSSGPKATFNRSAGVAPSRISVVVCGVDATDRSMAEIVSSDAPGMI